MSTVLVADEQAIIRELLGAALRAAGYQTINAADGRETLSQIASSKPDLVLLDLAMPVLDGTAVLRAIRAGPASKHLPVIILTAMADKARVLEAARLGVSGLMLKSKFSLRELLNLVQKHMRSQGQNASSEASPAGSARGPVAASVTAAAAQPPSDQARPASAAPAPNAWAGSPENQAEALRAIKPIMTRSELQRLVDGCGELKGFSPAVGEVLQLTGNDRCSIEQVSKAISRDHAVALKILKLANSAVYTRGEPVDSVHKAVLRIGLGQIRQTVLNLAVMDSFSGRSNGAIHGGQFWEHAIASGMIAAEIAHSRDSKAADAAFTTGLLHDVGRMVLCDQLGSAYQDVLHTAHKLQLPLEQVEQRMLTMNHADVMDRVFRQWKFSKHLINPIVFHHLSAGNIRKTAPQETFEIATLGLANRLAHALMLGASGNETIYPTEELCELLHLDASVIARIEGGTREETDKVKLALLATSTLANWPQLRDVHRQSLTRPLQPLYVSAAPAIDAHRILLSQLADENSQSPVNVGVIYFRSMRERTSLAHQYRQAEQAKGSANLPLLIISPGASIAPEASLVEGRTWVHLSTPLPLPRVITALNQVFGQPQVKAAA